jgi:hypothetical protein
MTKLITVFLIVLACFVGYRLYIYWEKVESEEDLRQEEEAKRRIVDPNQLPGLPWELSESLGKAHNDGAAFRRWLQANERRVQDPRLAWIQLDFVELIGRDSPNEARQIFNSVKPRVATNSPVYPRILKLEKTFQ